MLIYIMFFIASKADNARAVIRITGKYQVGKGFAQPEVQSI
ncbi:hypothetical protein [Herminiimonas sp. CN]|nr:hypothetical protein [Herminiimonas sp. CN]